jgi:hypothetical protein
MRVSSFLSAFAVAGLLAGSASADPIGPDDCSTCQGTSLELLYDPTPIASNGTTTYEITLRIDTSGYTGDAVRIGEVAFKVSPSLAAVTLLDAPGGAGEWSAILGGINANGCQANANNGFACTSSDNDAVAGVPDGTHEWVFQVEVPSDQDLFTAMFQGSVKARFLDAEGEKTGDLVSENITLQVIPEPGTAVLLGAGVLALGRRRSRA